MTITFDKNTANERTLPIDRINERPVDVVLSGSYDKVIDSAQDFPDLTPFVEAPDFDTVEITDKDGVAVPVCGDYDYISDILGSYYERTKTYSVQITLAKRAEAV